MFSPILAMASLSSAETEWPEPGNGISPSLTTSPSASSASLAMLPTMFWNCSLRATKSVSEFTSTTDAVVPLVATPTRPSAATRSAFLAALARPRVRSQSTAASMSPLVSARAFLQSIIPTPVESRSCLTRLAVISTMITPFGGPSPGPHGSDQDEVRMADLVDGRCFFGWQVFGRSAVGGTEIGAVTRGGTANAVDRSTGDQRHIEFESARGVVIAGDSIV